jgi:hypothetical protein
MPRAGRSYPNRAKIGQGLLSRRVVEVGVCSLGLAATATTAKNVPELASSAVGVLASGTSAKTVAERGTGVLGAAGTALGSKRAVSTSTSTAGIAGRATEARAAGLTSRACAGFEAVAAERRVAVVVTAALCGTIAAGTPRKTVSTLGRCPLGFTASRLNINLAAAGSCCVALTALSTPRRVAAVHPVILFGAVGAAQTRKQITKTGFSAVLVITHGAGSKSAPHAASALAGVRCVSAILILGPWPWVTSVVLTGVADAVVSLV